MFHFWYPCVSKLWCRIDSFSKYLRPLRILFTSSKRMTAIDRQRRTMKECSFYRIRRILTIYSSKCKDKDSQVHLTADEKDIVKLEKTLLVPCARAFFPPKPRRQGAKRTTTTGCFVVKTMLYWHAIFTKPWQNIWAAILRGWLQRRSILLRSFVKEKLSIFFLALLATTIRIICIFQLYFFVAVSLSFESPALMSNLSK